MLLENWQLTYIAKTIFFIEYIPITILKNNKLVTSISYQLEESPNIDKLLIVFDNSKNRIYQDEGNYIQSFEIDTLKIIVGPVAINNTPFLDDTQDNTGVFNSKEMFNEKYTHIKDILHLTQKEIDIESEESLFCSSSIVEQYLIIISFYARYKEQIDSYKQLFLKIEDNVYLQYIQKNNLFFKIQDKEISIVQKSELANDTSTPVSLIFYPNKDQVNNELILKLSKLISLKQQRSKIHTRSKLQNFIKHINDNIGGIASENLYTELVEKIKNITNLEYAVIYTYNASSNALKICATSDKDYLNIANLSESEKTNSIAYNALTQNRTLVLYAENYPKDITIQKTSSMSIKGVIATPIVFKCHIIGVLEISTEHDWRVSGSHKRKAKTIADIIAYFLYREMYLEGLKNIQQAVNDYSISNNDIYVKIANNICQMFLATNCILFKHQINGNSYRAEHNIENLAKNIVIEADSNCVINDIITSENKLYCNTDIVIPPKNQTPQK